MEKANILNSTPAKSDYKSLYEKAKNELTMLSEITNAIMQSLNIGQVLYTVLSALTSHEGLGFDRAMLFLVNKDDNTLDGQMGIGPLPSEHTDNIWTNIDNRKLGIPDLIGAYRKFEQSPDSILNVIIKKISIPLHEEMGILALTILEGMPFEVTTDAARSRVNSELKDLLSLENFVTVPLKTRDRVVGAILIDNVFSQETITKDNIRILNMFANHAALAVENSRLFEQSIYLSHTDWLTGLWNTRYFDNMLEKSLEKASENQTNISLLMIDIDNFKRFNDGLGHQEGDRAIRIVGNLLERHCRISDFVARYGGEEFCIVMTRIDKRQAMAIAERLRVQIEKAFKKDNTIPEDLKLTVSLGLAVSPEDGLEKNDLIKKADKAMYLAKRSGKNMTCQYSPEIE